MVESESDEPLTSEDDDDDDVKPEVSAPDTTDITLCCWNIKGDAKVKYRKAVTTKTFNEVYVPGASKPTKLNQCDIICLQETTRCTTQSLFQSTNVPSKVRKTLNSYIPIDPDRYGVITCREAGVDNAIFFNNTRFTLDIEKMNEEFRDAFELTDAKTEHRLRRERTTRECLEERMAIALLQDRECYIIVISIHSFRHKEPAQDVALCHLHPPEKIRKSMHIGG